MSLGSSPFVSATYHFYSIPLALIQPLMGLFGIACIVDLSIRETVNLLIISVFSRAMVLSLILPALVPSWRFFDGVAPSPRVQWGRVMGADSPKVWHEFRPRPAHVSLPRMMVRLFWNPAWNDNLYLVSCAERVQCLPTQHAVGDIRKRIQEEVGPAHAGEMLRFCLLYTSPSPRDRG